MTCVVVVHNRYVSSSPSGENDVVDDEIGFLRSAGHDVHAFMRDSDEIAQLGAGSRLLLAGRPVYSRDSARRFRELLIRVRPDVVHLHNPYPLISPWVVRIAAGLGVPVVQTVHNYRHGCVAGTLFRDGHTCEDCLGRALPWPAVAHGCYRGSRVQSVPMAVAQVAHRGTWQQVSRFLVLTRFMGDRLMATGISANRITVRPTGVSDPGPASSAGAGALFVGRLTEEKGIRLLLDAWELSGLAGAQELRIAGDGPLLEECLSAARRLSGIKVLGRVPADEISRLMAECSVVVVPSLWYEGFPRVVVEAFAHSRPVVSTTTGSLGEIVDHQVGWAVAASVLELAQGLVSATTGAEAAARGLVARARYEREYQPQVLLQQLLDTYAEVGA